MQKLPASILKVSAWIVDFKKFSFPLQEPFRDCSKLPSKLRMQSKVNKLKIVILRRVNLSKTMN